MNTMKANGFKGFKGMMMVAAIGFAALMFSGCGAVQNSNLEISKTKIGGVKTYSVKIDETKTTEGSSVMDADDKKT